LLIVNVQFSLSNHLGDLIADLSSAQKGDYDTLCLIRQAIFLQFIKQQAKPLKPSFLNRLGSREARL
ncbi:hypothetical protein, partial [Formosimonas limnophila]|uniref:hypothetical protein n=1 Tax=Formosimonas limnophila TaxID=1384487 RepID=UPI001E4922F7